MESTRNSIRCAEIWSKRLPIHTFSSIIRCIHCNSPLLPPSHSRHGKPGYEVFLGVLGRCKLSLDIKTAIRTHTQIIAFGYTTRPSVIALLLSTYVHCGRISLANKLIDRVVCTTLDLVAVNMVIDRIVKSGEYVIAKKVFDKLPVRDVVTWNSMIGGYVRNARFEEALTLFRAMLSSDVEPDKFTFASIITGCSRLGALNHARWVHDLLIEKKIELNFILSSALIDMYSKCGKIQTAREIFENVKRNDVSVWNSMINGLAVHGLVLDAISVFVKMEVENIIPDSITFLGLLTACKHCGLVKEGQHYFELMRIRYSIQPHLEHYGAMVDLLSRGGLLQEAHALIERMPMEPDVIIWRTMLSACRTYKKPELGEVAIENISRLRSGDYVLLANIYCSQKRWDIAQRVRETMRRKGVRKMKGKSWFERAGLVHQFKAGDRSHPETEAIYKVLEALIQRTKLEGFVPITDLVAMDVSEEEKEGNLYLHSEKIALAYAILKSSPATEIRISKNLRICNDCHNWIKLVSRLLGRLIIVRDRIRFHQFEGGFCSCGDYW